MIKTFKPAKQIIIAAAVAFVILFGLGTWQVVCLGKKTALLNKIDSRMAAAAVPLPEKIINPDEWKFRQVTLAGVFDFSHEFLIKPRSMDGVNGYHMFVPFKRMSGGTVLVNRGWISDEFIKKASRPSGIIKLEGVVQQPHKTSYTPENNPQAGDWYWPDLDAMAHSAGLKNVAPVIVNVVKRDIGVYPAGDKVAVNIRNNHKLYAFFWYGMAFIMLGVFYLGQRKTTEGSK